MFTKYDRSLLEEIRGMCHRILVATMHEETRELIIMGTIADVQREVEENATVMGSATLLLDEINQRLKDAIAQNDPAALQKLADDLDANTASLAAAVARNTPANDETPAAHGV